MTVELIYKTSSPKALEWWANAAAASEVDRLARRAFEKEMTELYGVPPHPDYFLRDDDARGKQRLLMRQGESMTGLDCAMNEKPPTGSGWRLDSKTGIWKPALAKAAGKKLAERLAGLTSYRYSQHLHEIGVAQLCLSGMYLFHAGLTFDEQENVIYQTWGSVGCRQEAEAESHKVDDVEWVEVPRSEWFARVERLSAQERDYLEGEDL